MKTNLFERRKFLKYSLIGVGGLVGATALGTSVFLSNKFDKKYGKLFILNGHLVDILHTFAEAAIPPPSMGFPSVEQAEVVKRLDEELYFVDDKIQSDFKALLYLIEAIPLAKGYFSRFSRLSVEDRLQLLKEMKETDNDLYRAAIANARMLVRMVYYGHPSTWQKIGYDGPFGGIPEVLSEQRKHYAKAY